MGKYVVSFTKYFDYTVEANSSSEAISKAQRKFFSEQRTPIADLTYDEVEIIDSDEDDDINYYEDEEEEDEDF